MIDQFTTARFEEALPKHNKTGEPLWSFVGLKQGERVYMVNVNEQTRIMIRSTIGSDGLAADSGEDSIRLWLELKIGDVWKPRKKMDAWTTRVAGWEKRMTSKLRELYRLALKGAPDLTAASPTTSTKTDISKQDHRQSQESTEKSSSSQDNSATSAESSSSPDSRVKMEFDDSPVPDAQTPGSKSEENECESPVTSCEDQKQEDGSSSPSPSTETSTETSPDSKQPFKKPSGNISELLSALRKPKDVLEDAATVVERALAEEAKVPNKEQSAAILHNLNRAACVLANAGSGKTYSIEERYKYMLGQEISPMSITVVTFSADMSKEMLQRIVAANPQIAGTGAERQICSIHALCNRIAVADGFARNIPDQGWKLKQIANDMIRDLWPAKPEGHEDARPMWKEVLNVVANLKYQCLNEEEDGQFLYEMYDRYHAQRVDVFREDFDAELRKEGWWTFNDMLYDVEKHLLTNQMALEQWQSRYQHIVVDEGQDTNWQSMRILSMLAAPQDQIFIVGDNDQTMFRFTGATPEVNLQEGFINRFVDGKYFHLGTNYRSTKEIVWRSSRMIGYNYENLGGKYDEVYHKEIRPGPNADDGAMTGWSWYDNQTDEAMGTVSLIQDLLEEGAKPQDIFVATRTKAQLAFLEGPLTRADIPFINITGGSFWQMKHVQDLLAYTRLTYHHDDAYAFNRIYNISSNNATDRYGEYTPTRYLGKGWKIKVGDEYDEDTILNESYSRTYWLNGAKDLTVLMNRLREMREKQPFHEVMRCVMRHCYEKYLRHEDGLESDDNTGKLEDLDAVMDLASEYGSLAEFMEMVDDSIQAAEDARNKNWGKYVVLSTAHRLKGMERDYMIGLGWCEGERKTYDGVLHKVGFLPHTFSLEPPPATGVLENRQQNPVEDERCIAYVIFTRAKKQAFLSGVQNAKGGIMWPSRFAKEMGLAPRVHLCMHCGDDLRTDPQGEGICRNEVCRAARV